MAEPMRVTRQTKRGRPERLTEEQKDTIVIRFNEGETQKNLAEDYDVALSTIRRVLSERRA